MPVISKLTVGGHEVTKYNNQRLRQFEINGEVCPFAKVAQSLNGILSDPISYRIHRLQAAGNSSQATGSVPKYNCQGHSSVLKIGSIIASGVMTVPNTSHGVTVTFNATNGTWVCTGTSDAVSFVSLYNQITLTSGHKYLVPAYRDATQAATTYYRWGGKAITSVPAANFYWPDQNSARSWAIITGDGTTGYCTFTFRSGLDTEVSGFEPAGCFNLIDLTELYGAGNEPANPETVFQDYPEIPVGNDSWIKNDVIRSISSITLGGQTVSVDLRSAGSVYDEWASNSRGTRKIKKIANLASLGWQTDWYTEAEGYRIYVNLTDKARGIGNLLCAAYPNAGTGDSSMANKTITGNNGSGYIYIKDDSFATAADLIASLTNVELLYELATPTAFTAGSPLTLASGLTPTDQNGDAVTFTETIEATPSPNYPVPIVNSTLISITDGQDTNSASIDLAGLTDKDEYYVNVKSTNLWNEKYEIGLYNSSGEKAVNDYCIRCKDPIAVEAERTYTYMGSPKRMDNGVEIQFYDESNQFISRYVYQYTNLDPLWFNFTTPSGCAFVTFYYNTGTNIDVTYLHDISISLYNGSPVPYMPHNTKGKVWYKQQVGRVDLSTQSYDNTTVGTKAVKRLNPLSGMVRTTADGSAFIGLAENYKVVSYSSLVSASDYGYVAQGYPSGYIYFYTWGNLNPSGYLYYLLSTPTWTDITSTPTGQALLSLETYEGDNNTATVNNGGTVEMVEYFQPI